MEVTWESNDDEWWDAAKTQYYDLSIGPWSMIGKGILDLDRLIYHRMMYSIGMEDEPCWKNNGDDCEGKTD